MLGTYLLLRACLSIYYGYPIIFPLRLSVWPRGHRCQHCQLVAIAQEQHKEEATLALQVVEPLGYPAPCLELVMLWCHLALELDLNLALDRAFDWELTSGHQASMQATSEPDSTWDTLVNLNIIPFQVALMVNLHCTLEHIAMAEPLRCLLVLLLEDHPYPVGLPYLDSMEAFLLVEVVLLKELRSSMVDIEEQQQPLLEEHHQRVGQRDPFYLNNC